MTDAKSAIARALLEGKIGEITRGTYESLTARITPEGFLAESPGGKYSGCYPRSVGAFAIALHEMGELTMAKKLLSYLLDRVIDGGMPDIPHVLYNSSRKEVMIDQLDATTHNILAYALLALDGADADFEQKYYPWCRRMIVRSFRAPYFYDGNPRPDTLDENAVMADGTRPQPDALCLSHNFFFEHSRDYVMWDCADMLTQTFSGAAGEAMASLARRRGDTLLADWLDIRTAALRRGIRENLTFIDPEYGLIYGEMRVNISETERGTVFPALGWPLLAPAAIEWNGVDPEIYARTVRCVLARTALRDPVSTLTVYMDEYEPDGRVYTLVYGKIMAWQIDFLRGEGEWDKILEILRFIEIHTKGNILPERFDPVRADGEALVHRGKMLFEGELPADMHWYCEDVGNAEQCIWFWLSMQRLLRAVTQEADA